MTIDGRIAGFDHKKGAELVRQAAALQPLLATHAQQAEECGEIDDKVIAALLEAGLLRMAAPRRLGGLAVSSEAMTEVARELAKGCPSTAWVTSIINSCVWIASTMAPGMQALIFAGEIPTICGPNNGIGHIVPADDGGFTVSGQWAYASGSHHAKWALVPALDEAKQINMVVLPMEAVTTLPTWQVAGMKGTGSDTLVAENVAITAEMFCPLAMGSTVGETPYEKEATDYWVPFALLRAKALGVLLGAAEALLGTVLDLAGKPIIYSTYAARRDSHVWQAGVGEATAAIGIARSIIMKHNRHNDAAAAQGRALSADERASCRGECAMVVDILTRTVEQLMSLSGSSSFATKMPAQRFWRDFSVGARHVIFNSDLGYEVLGRQVLGIEPNIVAFEQI